ncbi:MAG: Gfo/Idh/MocA family oxidoreductase [Methylocystaceae bacterium]|nr:Gfo/Idh/MocA family oxidoreductase [Methylocystaceae bacterium]
MNLPSLHQKTLRLGFIGGALSSAVGYAHWSACQLDQRWQVVAGCFSRNAQENMSTAQAWNIPENHLYLDWQELIAKEKDHLDAVVVLTPTPHHHDIVCASLEAGLGVICEKAMTANLAQSRQIQESLSKTKGFLAVTFNYSGYPLLRDLQRHVQEGTLGKLTQIQIEMPSDAFIQDKEKMKPQEWRLSDGEIPTILLDLAVHVHHLCSFVTNGLKPAHVNADFHHDSIFDNIVDDAYLWVKFEQDFRASMWVSKSALGYRNGLKLRLFGDKASAEWLQEEPERLHIFQKDTSRITYDRGNCKHPDVIRDRFKPGHPGGFVEAFANLYSDIADAYEEFTATGSHTNPYVFGWEHAHEGLTLLTGAARANKQKNWISLSKETEQ